LQQDIIEISNKISQTKHFEGDHYAKDGKQACGHDHEISDNPSS
jgi:hypothetical protein